MLHDGRLRSMAVIDRDHERALAGACMIDDRVARMLLAELDEQAFLDPTARLAMWAVRRGLEAADEADDLDVPKGEPSVMTDVAMIVEALDCAGACSRRPAAPRPWSPWPRTGRRCTRRWSAAGRRWRP